MQDERWENAKGYFGFTFALAIVLNIVDAAWDIDGAWWTALRAAVGVLWLVALVNLVAVFLARRRPQP